MPFLNVEDLTVRYAAATGDRLAVDAVSFAVGAHEMVGVSGPSGSGKTTMALAMLGLLPAEATVSGAICFNGRDLRGLREHELDAIRGAEIGIVFQESALALNPVLTVGAQIAEVVRAHVSCDKKTARERARAAMVDVGLSENTARIYDAYPHELSGGQRQRVLIAQALVCQPALVVADEPTASLDAAVRDEVLNLIRRLNERHGTAFLIISHSVDVLAATTERVIVMDAGRVVGTAAPRRNTQSSGLRLTPVVSKRSPAPHCAPIATLTGATKSYRQKRLLSRSHADVQALEGVDLRVERGDILGLAGPSGCGKSTLARCLAGLETLDAGQVHIDGHDITTLRGRALQPFRNQVQLIFQDSAAALNPRFTALDIITEPLVIQGTATAHERTLRAIDLMSQVGLPADRLGSRAAEFSGGERQRLAIARALAVRPTLLILDEAFSGLDVETRTRITGLLISLQEEHDLSLLCISHDLALLEDFASDVVVMSDGAIVERRTPDHVFARPDGAAA